MAQVPPRIVHRTPGTSVSRIATPIALVRTVMSRGGATGWVQTSRMASAIASTVLPLSRKIASTVADKVTTGPPGEYLRSAVDAGSRRQRGLPRGFRRDRPAVGAVQQALPIQVGDIPSDGRFGHPEELRQF